VSSPIDAVVARYLGEHDRYLRLADAVASSCRRLADRAEIQAVLQWRVKSPDRVRAKLERLVVNGSGGDPLDALGDLAGVRVATFVERDRAPMVAAIGVAFLEVDVDVKDAPNGFYRATNCQVRLSPGDADAPPAELVGLSCEIQVCSLFAQAWNEIEHGLVYVAPGEPSHQQLDALQALGVLTEAGDALVTSLLAM
jgi:ppGpp synthetase/RelA/SpoT-type nucleotidyltranferase